jgi:hypothetical protein
MHWTCTCDDLYPSIIAARARVAQGVCALGALVLGIDSLRQLTVQQLVDGFTVRGRSASVRPVRKGSITGICFLVVVVQELR